ncbi:hypothetical protein S7711_02701 [Stachybotrys chartarum IBT 7711]|uniref:Uncharacterized protein n=1 Tax=Stachybotrys chartarum (strain CBS 109288 / IBT 7711) TaxID=1280523 RepID=A0A084AZ14_STACB|nr:hypothetical protein S7711_02701 [Stachybotrys chartarum IBT 7711]
MASAAPSSEANGPTPSRLTSIPATFVEYFPIGKETTRPQPTDAEKATGTMPIPSPWAIALAPQLSGTRLPAWTRVEVKPRPASGRTGTIWKRVRDVAPVQRSKIMLDVDEEPSVRNVRQKHTHVRSEKTIEFAEPSVSDAQIASSLLETTGKLYPVDRHQTSTNVFLVDYVNNLIKTNPEIVFGDVSQLGPRPKSPAAKSLVPAKRRLNSDTLKTGYSLSTSVRLIPILNKMLQDDLLQMDLETAALVYCRLGMRSLRRDRRVRLAEIGAPDLSVIADVTEPEASILSKPPTVSPIKKDTATTSPLRTVSRLNDTKIVLSPATVTQPEPSPTKMDAEPSTPLKTATAGSASLSGTPRPVFQSPDQAKNGSPSSMLSQTPSHTEDLTSVSENVVDTSPTQKIVGIIPFATAVQQQASPTSARHPGTFRMYSTDTSSASSEDQATQAHDDVSFALQNTDRSLQSAFAEQTSAPAPELPSWLHRPVAPTPSRALRQDTTTPLRAISMSPVSMTPLHQASFMFGATSPGFTAHPTESAKAKRSRKSEPLLRTILVPDKRRQTTSHGEIAGAADMSCDVTADTFTSPFTRPSESAEGPAQVAPLADASDPFIDSTVIGTPAAGATTSFVTARETIITEQSVNTVDARENTDIFHPNPSVNRLAQIVDTACDGFAKVTVALENGRLMVRFKLPAEYAISFPVSQGFDESRFTTSPSISASPRLKFGAVRSAQAPTFTSSPLKPFSIAGCTRDHAQSSPAGLDRAPLWQSVVDNDQTLAVADFELQTPSNQAANLTAHTPNRLPRWNGTTPNGDETLAMSGMQDFGNLARQASATPPRATKSAAEDQTFGTASRLQAQSPDLFKYSISGIGIVDRDTPESQRFSVMPSAAQDQTRGTPSTMSGVQRSPATAVCSPVATPNLFRHSMSGIGIVDRDTPEDRRFSIMPNAAGDQTFGTPGAVSETQASPATASGTQAESPDIFRHSISGIGVVDRDTPEHRRVSIMPSYTPVSSPALNASVMNGQTPSPSIGGNAGAQRTSVQPDVSAMLTGSPAVVASPNVSSTTPIVNGHFNGSHLDQSLDLFRTPSISGIGITDGEEHRGVSVSPAHTPVGTPTLNTSWTPVNQPTPRIVITSPPGSIGRGAHADSPTPAPSAPIIAAAAEQTAVPQQPVDDDSPGREHLREFIKRASKPKRLSTTETGSPMVTTAKRQPLGAKSPNAGSPEKVKRKHEKDADASPKRDPVEPAPKRVRRGAKEPKHRAGLQKEEETADQLIPTTETPDADEEPATRRSSRIRGLDGSASTARSSIPTAITLNRPGARRGVANQGINSAVRSEQQDLTHQTRMNTRKNRGNAEYPSQVLAKRSHELSGSDEEQGEAPTRAKRGKSVVWKEPLELEQGARPKKTKESAPKAADKKVTKGSVSKIPASKAPAAKTKPTQGTSGIAKPKKAPSQRQRTEQATQQLERAGNGTPARPQRMTRSRTRSQQ